MIDKKLSDAELAVQRGDHKSASALYLQASELERTAASERGRFAAPDRSFTYQLQAAFQQCEAGMFSAAEPTLYAAFDFDWREARQWGNRHLTESAFVYALSQIAVDGTLSAFDSMWERARRRGVVLEMPFPWIIPNKKAVLKAAFDVGHHSALRDVVNETDQDDLADDDELRDLLANVKAKLVE